MTLSSLLSFSQLHIVRLNIAVMIIIKSCLKFKMIRLHNTAAVITKTTVKVVGKLGSKCCRCQCSDNYHASHAHAELSALSVVIVGVAGL